MAPQVILYGYPQSPFFQKLKLVLLFKSIPYRLVIVDRMPPRPPLLKLGITYRRIPVLAIGGNLIFDTSLAVTELERVFPSPSLQGPNWGLEQGAAFYWTDRSLFSLAGILIPWDAMTPEFRKDRAKFGGRGDDIDPRKMAQLRPAALSALRSHLALVEQQLAKQQGKGGTPFMTASDTPTYLDLSLFFVLDWVANFPTTGAVFPKEAGARQPFPLVAKWLATMRGAVKAARKTSKGAEPTETSADEAAKLIWAAAKEAGGCGVEQDASEPLLVAGWLRIGDQTKVTPADTGKVDQVGTLEALTAKQVVLRVESEVGHVWVHTPRLAYEVAKA